MIRAYDVALIVTVLSGTYEQALERAEALAAGVGDAEQMSVSAKLDYEHDNEGQRIVYLHAEGDPA